MFVTRALATALGHQWRKTLSVQLPVPVLPERALAPEQELKDVARQSCQWEAF